MRIALINGPLKSAVCDLGVGHQLPLGLLMVGGPLIDAGHEVCLIDGACEHLGAEDIARRVAAFGAHIAMIAHVGSTAAHPVCLSTLRAVKATLPHVVTVYGGVYPTYSYRQILAEHPEVDIIVRGEGEAATLELVNALAQASQSDVLKHSCDLAEAADLSRLAHIPGLALRRDGTPVSTGPRAPIEDLDAYRIGWELIRDWDCYQAFGIGRAAVVQFSRGCPHTCTYCGQWMFWKRWRHRDVTRFVDELEAQHRTHDVRFLWLADENPTTLKDVWRGVLAEIAARRRMGRLDITMCASIRAQDIVRDADILSLYRDAGFLYVLMGVETVSDATLDRIHKGMSVDDAYRAVRLLRAHGILSIVDYIFGLEDETPRTIWRGLRGLQRYDGDFLNALYITPHSWTPLGHALADAPLVEPDVAKWDYRHQVLAVKHLTPTQLFLGVKLVELIYSLSPRRLMRILTASDRRSRRQLRYSLYHTAAVFMAELVEHFYSARRNWRRDTHVTASAPVADVRPLAQDTVDSSRTPSGVRHGI